MNNSQNRDPRALRSPMLGAADFDYTDRSSCVTDAGLHPYILRHADAALACPDFNSIYELAIRDSAIDFLTEKLEVLGAAALTFTTITRLTSEMRKAGIEIPDDIKKGVADLFEELEALVGG